jgi:hypothetical protein
VATTASPRWLVSRFLLSSASLSESESESIHPTRYRPRHRHNSALARVPRLVGHGPLGRDIEDRTNPSICDRSTGLALPRLPLRTAGTGCASLIFAFNRNDGGATEWKIGPGQNCRLEPSLRWDNVWHEYGEWICPGPSCIDSRASTQWPEARWAAGSQHIDADRERTGDHISRRR